MPSAHICGVVGIVSGSNGGLNLFYKFVYRVFDDIQLELEFFLKVAVALIDGVVDDLAGLALVVEVGVHLPDVLEIEDRELISAAVEARVFVVGFFGGGSGGVVRLCIRGVVFAV